MLKKLLTIVIVLAAIVAGVTFAARNPQEVSLSYYFDITWQGPLVFALLTALVTGFVLAAVPLWFRIFRLRRKLAAPSTSQGLGVKR